MIQFIPQSPGERLHIMFKGAAAIRGLKTDDDHAAIFIEWENLDERERGAWEDLAILLRHDGERGIW